MASCAPAQSAKRARAIERVREARQLDYDQAVRELLLQANHAPTMDPIARMDFVLNMEQYPRAMHVLICVVNDSPRFCRPQPGT